MKGCKIWDAWAPQLPVPLKLHAHAHSYIPNISEPFLV